LPLCAQTVIYVDADVRGGARNGTTWQDAYPELFEALAHTTGPAEIWVAEGTYRPSYALNRADVFTLVDGVDLYGGFQGTESLREERDADAHPTLLTGDLMLDDDSGGTNAENSYHVLHCPSGTVALDAFTIHGGNTTGAASNPNGGAAYGAGSLTFTHCLFRGHQSTNNGGAIYQDSGSTYTFSHCRFEDNSASGSGGAIQTRGLLHLSDCSFINNDSADDGGAVDFLGAAASTITRCTFDANQCTREGGGLHIKANLTNPIRQCTFTSNGADDGGGVMTEVSFTRPGITFTHCLFAGNDADSAGGGAATYSGIFINCEFLGNTADGAGGGGGAGPPFGSDFSDGPAFINCSFQGNTADGAGGGAVAGPPSTSFENCILWNNEDNGSTTTPEASFAITVAGLGSTTFTHTLAQGWNPPGTGNINGTDLANAPLFVSPVDPATAPHTTGDLRLLASSPGLDAGDNTLNSEPLDIAGQTRIQNTTIDMGAHEAIPIAEITVYDDSANELTDNGPALDLGVLRLEDLSTTIDFTIENMSLVALTGVGVTASGPNAPDVSVSVTPASSVAPYSTSAFQITLTFNNAGPVDTTLAIANNDSDENPFDIPLTGFIASDLTDGDSDGLSDYQDLLNGTDPDDPDADGDGVLDGAELSLAALGFQEGTDDSALLALLQGNSTGVGLYTETNLQSFAMGRPVISRDPVSGNFTIATGILQSPDLITTPFAPLINYTPTFIPGTGEILLEFAPPSPDAHFFQIFGTAPTP